MIKNPLVLERFHQQLLADEKFSYRQSLKIFESLYREAKTLGVVDHNPFTDLEGDFRIARILNKSCHV